MVLVISNNTPFSAMDPPAGNELSPGLNVVKSRPRQPEPPASAKALAAALVAQQSKDDETLDARDACPVKRDNFPAETSSFRAESSAGAAAKPSDSSKVLPFKTPDKPRQVDYDDDCTTLYKKIENKDWYAVDLFLENGYWPGSLLEDKMTPGQQASTWVTRYEYESNCLSILPHFITLPDPTGVLWSTLPLHLAVALKAPFTTVGRLVEHYPMALKCPDSQGLLPINLAIRNGCADEVLDYLFCAYPNAVFIMSEDGKASKDISPLGVEVLAHDAIRARVRHNYICKAEKKSRENEAKREAQRGNEPKDSVTRESEMISSTGPLVPNEPGGKALKSKEELYSQHQATKKFVANHVGQIRECNYEANCTMLCKKIEKKEWASVETFLKEGYWPGDFFSDPKSPLEQVTTWITRYDRKDASKTQWSILPLHLAIILDAPCRTIGCLVEICPASVRCGDDKGMLPLHLAMLHGTSNQVVDLLYMTYPDAIDVRAGKFNLSPLDCAMVGNDKVRARILDAFMEKSQLQATKTVAKLVSKQISQLKATIQSKEQQQQQQATKVELKKKFNDISEQFPKECEGTPLRE